MDTVLRSGTGPTRVDTQESVAGGHSAAGDVRTRQIVEAFGGSIRVESQPGRGALFTVELPLQSR